MKRAKIRAMKLTVILFMILILCTVAAYRVEELLVAEVWSYEVKPAVGQQPVLLPKACVKTDMSGKNYVMLLEVRRGLWGMEEYVEKEEVEISEETLSAYKLHSAALDGKKLAIYPSRELVDYEVVRCIGECR